MYPAEIVARKYSSQHPHRKFSKPRLRFRRSLSQSDAIKSAVGGVKTGGGVE